MRRLAARKLAHEPAGQSLHATALVHEAYLRLVDCERPQQWDRRSGDPLDERTLAAEEKPEEILFVNEALEELEHHDPQIAALVKLRYFAGLSHQESAAALGIGRRQADRLWSLARGWLYRRLAEDESSSLG